MFEKFDNIICFIAIACFGIFLRASISLYSYSGKDKPPMFGDFEAQRHWQEICINLPITNWYQNTTDNDLMYWGLDYPPLTAYHSLIIGKIAKKINPLYVELHKSRGISIEEHKIFMRLTVLLGDMLIYIPAIFLSAKAITKLYPKQENYYKIILNLMMMITYPAQILIDNGHFQYNNISLGLFLYAVSFIIFDYNLVAGIFFSLALNYKQMELYHALPFFIYLLRNSFFPDNRNFSLGKGSRNLLKIGLIVILTFGIIWMPWLNSMENFLSVVRRIFPVARGVFEDKVSNFWCVLNVFIKIKHKFTNEFMVIMCLITTLLMSVPSCLHLFINGDKKSFLYTLVNTSFSFFLFSFQVHEKSILLVGLPILLISPFEPFISFWFLQISTFSMIPLLEKDGLLLPFISTYIIFTSISYFVMRLKQLSIKREYFIIYYLSILIEFGLIICHLFCSPPSKLPHLYPFLISAYSFICFIIIFIYFNIKQLYNKV